MTGTELDDENQMQLTDIDSGQVSDEGDTGSVACVIVHEPTRKELAASVRSCLQHAMQLVSADFAPSVERAKLARAIASGEFELDGAVKISRGHGLVLGTDPDRAHVDAGVTAVDSNPVTHVVVNNLAALGETHAEVRDRVDVLVRDGAELHLNDVAAEIDSDSADAVLGVLESLDKAGVELQREAEVQDVRDWLDDRSLPDRGRAPLGFEYDDGELVTAEDYDEVRAVLSMARAGPDGDRELSKRKAAERLGVADRTIGRALDNAGRYGLEDTGE